MTTINKVRKSRIILSNGFVMYRKRKFDESVLSLGTLEDMDLALARYGVSRGI